MMTTVERYLLAEKALACITAVYEDTESTEGVEVKKTLAQLLETMTATDKRHVEHVRGLYVDTWRSSEDAEGFYFQIYGVSCPVLTLSVETATTATTHTLKGLQDCAQFVNGLFYLLHIMEARAGAKKEVESNAQ